MQTVKEVIDCCPLWLYRLEILVRIFSGFYRPLCLPRRLCVPALLFVRNKFHNKNPITYLNLLLLFPQAVFPFPEYWEMWNTHNYKFLPCVHILLDLYKFLPLSKTIRSIFECVFNESWFLLRFSFLYISIPVLPIQLFVFHWKLW